MTVYLLRHAHAGERSAWRELRDELRPLSDHGRRQSADLVKLFADLPIDRVWTSPYLRCVESVAPLSARLGVASEITDALAEGPAVEALALLLCSTSSDQPTTLTSARILDVKRHRYG
jgi:broad specificity phosphatase PhoE